MDNSAADGDALVIADVLRRHAVERGDKPAYVFLDHNVEPIRTFTYAELDRRARAVGAELVAAGAADGRCLISSRPRRRIHRRGPRLFLRAGDRGPADPRPVTPGALARRKDRPRL